MQKQILLTVFTPAYNRAYTLVRTYESLRRQTDKRFIWMIIDDGSTDNTAELVSDWIKNEKTFQILYFYKPNGGMHTAHNLAYSNITTELNVCIDSDDLMPTTAVEDILSFWKFSSKDENVAGIVALDCDTEGRIIGSRLPDGIIKASTHDLYEKYGVVGDKKYIYRTAVTRSAPAYPEFEGEKLVPLGYKYELISDSYSMLLLNKAVCVVEYQADGSSNTIYKQYMQSPRGFAVDKIVRIKRTNNFVLRTRYIVHYLAECRIARDPQWLKNSPAKFMSIMLYPFGMAFEIYIRFINRRNKTTKKNS